VNGERLRADTGQENVMPSLHPRLPPLNTLRAFRAVMRCGNLQDAAGELLVTPQAVGHQMRMLEAPRSGSPCAPSKGKRLPVANDVVHVVDDDVDVRKSLGFLLATADFAVRLHESATAFLAMDLKEIDGCIVTDVRMPGIDGIEFLRQLKARGHNLPVIVMTGHADVALAVQAMKEGAADFIEKPFDDQVLIDAIHSALANRTQAASAYPQSAEIRKSLSTLSERERQVLDGLVSGLPNKTIAYDLGISPRTVEIHRANLMSKMGAGSLSHLVRMALIADPSH